MKIMTKFITVTGAIATLMLGASTAYAAPFPVPQGPPVWCYGQDEFGRCLLFLGNEQSCMNLEPCNSFAAAVPGDPFEFEIWFCMGQDEFGRCQLFAGSREACMDVEPCAANIGQLPKVLRSRDGNGR